MAIANFSKNVTEKVIRDERFLPVMREYIDIAALSLDFVAIKEWLRGLQGVIKQSSNPTELQELLAPVLSQMYFLSFPVLNEDELPEVFSFHIAQGLRIATQADLWRFIRTRLAFTPIQYRNLYKSEWLKALHNNSEQLTSKSIVAGGATVAGTVMNWVKDFDLAMGSLAPADPLKKTQYLFRGANILKTPEGEREYIKRLIDIYEKLKLDSLSLETMEDSPILEDQDGRLLKIVDGVVYDLDTGKPITDYKLKLPTPTAAAASGATVQKPTRRVPAPVKSAPATIAAPQSARRAVVVPPEPLPVAPIRPPMPTRITRPIPSMSSPQQKPQLGGSLPTGTTTPGGFSDADENEVAQIKAVQKNYFKAPPGIDYDYVASRVIARHKLFFPSYDMEKRFVNLITSYVKGVRDEMEFRDVMTRPENTGGLNQSGDTTDKALLTAAEVVKEAPLQKAQGKMSMAKSPLAPTMGQVRKAIARTKAAEPTLSATGEMQAAVPAQPTIIRRQVITPKVDTQRIAPSAVRAPLDMGKPMVTDIKIPPRVMGPVEELANLTLQEFHRLGTTSSAITEKIRSKLDILEAESLLKRNDGVRAWQQSPVNQLYLAIGQEALNTTQQVGNVIQARLNQKQPTLTLEEFDAIADLNKRLRY